MARREIHDNSGTAGLAMLIVALVLIVAAAAYVGIDQMFGEPGLRELRIERPHLPVLPPKLPETPRLPEG